MRLPKSKPRAITLILASGLALTGCSREGTPREQGHDGGLGGGALSFVNRVWEVESSSSVAPGTLYVFLSDGTLLITSAHGTPLLGSWRYAGRELTMIEEGRPYKVAILQSSAGEFRIRITNPGEPVEIGFVPASPLPK